MLDRLTNRNNVIALVLASGLGVFTVLNAIPTKAGSFNAKTVIDKMSSEEKASYIAGLIDGLAYARYKNEGKKTDGGMKCIYDWYQKKEGTVENIILSFHKYKTYTPNAIIAAMIEKECGE